MFQLRFRYDKIFLLWFALLCGASNLAYAQATAIAYVKTVSGDAWISTNGQIVKAALGVSIFKGSRLKTSPAASLGVTFIDNTVMSFGENTEITVDDYLYSPSQGDLQLGVNLIKGTLNYVSGVIAKLKPESVTVRTPTGIIGVRGTQFVAQVSE